MQEGVTQVSGERISLTEEQALISSGKFRQQGYCVFKAPLSPRLVGLMQNYISFYTRFHPSYFVKVDNSLIRYGDLLFESTLTNIQHLIEQASGRQLLPVFSIIQSLPDQESFGNINYGDTQGISALISINTCNTDSLAFEIQGGNGTSIPLNSGELLIYDTEKVELKGKEASSGENTVGLFHYVDTSGKFTDWKFDKRANIGTLISRPEMEAKIKTLKG